MHFRFICLLERLYTCLTSDDTDHTKVGNILADLFDLITIFKNEFSTVQKSKKGFVSDHKCELFIIHDVLVGKLKKSLMSKMSKNNCVQARMCHHSLFRFLEIKQPMKRFASLPTELCQEFCQGITYFTHDILPPTKENMKRCFLEMLIYDAIYLNTFHRQDLKHLYALRTMEQQYKKNFNNTTIGIHIHYTDLIHPQRLSMYCDKCTFEIMWKTNKQNL